MSSKIFKWNQPSGKVWTIETNTEEKYIITTDENGKEIQSQENMSEGAINFMIDNFISVVATEENKKPNPNHEYNSMYA